MTRNDEAPASLRDLLRDIIRGRPIDSNGFAGDGARLLASHRLQPLAERSIRASAGVDPRWTDVLDAARRLRLRNALLRLELARLVIGLDAAGCEPIVLKGAALAHTAYSDPGDRYFGDLDILVPKERLADAVRVVEAAGYATSRHARATAAQYDRHHFHRVLVSAAGIRVELHWDLTRPTSAFRFDLAGFRRRSRTIDAEGARLRVPSDGDQVLHAACQAAKDGFLELRRVVDAARLARCGAFDEADLAERARLQGLGTPTWLLAALAGDLAGATLPSDFLDRVRPHRLTVRCLSAARLPDALLSTAPRRAGERQWVRWWCSPNARAGIRAAAQYVFPTAEDVFDEGDAPSFKADPLGSTLATLRRAGSAARVALVFGARLLDGGDGPRG